MKRRDHRGVAPGIPHTSVVDARSDIQDGTDTMPFSTSSFFARCRKCLVMSLPLLILLGGFAPRAEAEYLVSNLTSTSGFNPLNGYNLIGPGAVKNTNAGYAIAVRFTIASSQSMAFDSAQLALVYRGGSNALDISLLSDQKGIPGGSALETIHIANVSSTAGLVTVNSTLHPVLSAGVSYWLVATYSAVDTNIAWLFNSQGRSGLAAYRLDTLTTQGIWLAAPTLTDPAFTISGSASQSFAVVDAPSSGVLTAIAGLGLFGGHHFQRRRATRRDVTA